MAFPFCQQNMVLRKRTLFTKLSDLLDKEMLTLLLEKGGEVQVQKKRDLC